MSTSPRYQLYAPNLSAHLICQFRLTRIAMMFTGVPLFVSFAVLAGLINGESEIPRENEMNGVHQTLDGIFEGKNQGRPIKPLYEKDGFLAGEETPVWLAGFQYNNEHRVEYTFTRFRPRGLPMVKRAMNSWKSLKSRGGFPIRRIPRSVDDRGNLTNTEHFDDVLRNVKIKDFASPSLVEKRSVDSNEVIYPSLLVVMDYHDVFPTDDKKMAWSIEHLILYALAFWGTVDSSLRNVQNPRVSLSIAGIIITEQRNSFPYMTEASHSRLFVRALSPMINHWTSVSRMKYSDYPTGSYDIVVHMTDIFPWTNYKQSTEPIPRSHPYLAVATEGPLCQWTNQIGGVIVHDNLSFNGVHWAIAQMINALGGSDDVSEVKYGFPRRRWTKDILDSLSNALKNTSCMSAPKHHYKPGPPVEPILAGELLPNGKQCELYDYASDAWTCWDTSISARRSNCYMLFCSNQHVWGVTCSEVGVTLDGSFCNAENTKICLDGLCVDKK